MHACRTSLDLINCGSLTSDTCKLSWISFNWELFNYPYESVRVTRHAIIMANKCYSFYSICLRFLTRPQLLLIWLSYSKTNGFMLLCCSKLLSLQMLLYSGQSFSAYVCVLLLYCFLTYLCVFLLLFGSYQQHLQL